MTTSNEVTAFNFAQTFFLDPGSVKNAPEISLTSIGIYFKKKPKATGNISGLANPGVTVYLTSVKTSGSEEVPDPSGQLYGGVARIEYANIVASDTAAVETKITFPFPVNVKTSKNYAIIVKYDGNEEFAVWNSVQGNILVGTNTSTAGPAGKYIGKYFEYSYTTGSSAGTWKPLSTTDLKFNLYAAKFISDTYANTQVVDSNGNTVTNVIGSRSYLLYKDPYEFIIYDKSSSINSANLIGGELIYQKDIIYNEPVSVKAGSNTVSTQSANFNLIFGNSTENDRYIVVFDGSKKNIRKVTEIKSNTVLEVDIPFTISNNISTFSRVAAGVVDFSSVTLAFGTYEDAVVLNKSNANSTVRFVNNSVESITINSGGTGYHNTNIIRVSNGGQNASANVITNGNGVITAIFLRDKGYGFLNTPTISILAANGSTANGTTANLAVTIGSTLLTESSNATLANTRVINAPVSALMVAAVDIENPYGTTVGFKNHYVYSSISDGISDIAIQAGGSGYTNGSLVSFSNTGGGTGAIGKVATDSTGKIVDIVVLESGSGYKTTTAVAASGGTNAVLAPVIGVHNTDMNNNQNQHAFDLFEKHKLPPVNTPIVISRSYEVTQPLVTITTVTGKTVNTNISSVVEMIITSNNEFTSADIVSGEIDVFYEKNLINNSYENEHLGNGKALAKHISDTISFSQDVLPEDVRVFIDAYRPLGTDLKVYGKIYNNHDPEVFTSKNWTLLELKSNNSIYSDLGNEGDTIEFEYGFSSYPNSSIISSGGVTTTLSSANVTGSNVNFSTALAVNDLVKVHSPLFPDNYIVDVVSTINSNTSITLRNAVTNNSVVGTGLAISKINYKNQAFNYKLNGNSVRYYNSAMAEFDGYNSIAIKIVFLSNNEFIVPKADVNKVIGVTA